MDTCSIPDCPGLVQSRGLCANHYRRWLRKSPNWDKPVKVRAVTVCSIEGCGSPALSKTWCRVHYYRWVNHGDPNTILKPRSLTGICDVTGCERPHQSHGRCATHNARFMKHGDVEVVAKGGARRRPGHRSATKAGYVLLYDPTHELATRSGQVLEHRSVLFDKIGLGPHLCHHCGEPINWRWPIPFRLEIDHLDWVITNNDPANLVPSCIACNSKRHQG